MYYIGIDGGGTSTVCSLFKNHKEIDTITLSSCHFLQVGYDGCASIIKKGIDSLLLKHHLSHENVVIGIGMAGYGNDSKIRHNIEVALSKQIPYTMYITNDIHIALLGALDGEDGIMVIVGTGSIAMAKVDNRIQRIGSWGYQLGDEGSGYWIGKQLLSAFTKQVDGRMEKSLLYTRIHDYFALEDDYDSIRILNSKTDIRKEIAKLSKVCDALAKQKDDTCINILKRAAYEVSLCINGLKKYYKKQPKVSYYGSVCHSELFLEALKEYAGVGCFIEPKHNAQYGAYLYALQKQKEV